MFHKLTPAEALNILNKTPALSIGLCIFAFLFYLARPAESKALILYPDSPLELNLNAISLYIFPHVNWIHLLLNLISLFPLLSAFEKVNGTIRTGITLNLLAVITALLYCIPGLLLYPQDGVAGLLGLVFSFLTYFCQKEYTTMPSIFLFKIAEYEVSVPTQYFPFVNLFLIALILPSSSFFGHLAGIGAGYLLVFNYIDILFPPLTVLLYIESKLSIGISKLKLLVDFVSEEDAVVSRGNAYAPLFSRDLEASSDSLLYQNFERRVGE